MGTAGVVVLVFKPQLTREVPVSCEEAQASARKMKRNVLF